MGRKPVPPHLKKKSGRPMKPVPAGDAASLLTHLRAGGARIEWCERTGISHDVIAGWRAKDPDFAHAYARAREEGEEVRREVMARDVLELADKPADANQVPQLRVQVDARLKLMQIEAWRNSKRKVEHEGGIHVNLITGVPRGGATPAAAAPAPPTNGTRMRVSIPPPNGNGGNGHA